ncbi:MAG: hypothetical protein IT368_10545, partial [Candidatus Hydrogenedentes bacterium]|nr:hypothetical protein [Candidatus Hydrogenedentota bacterium]
YAAPGSADAFLGRWRFVSSLIPGHLDIVDANDGVLSAVYRPDLENSASILGEAAAETGRVTFDLPDHTAPTGGKFIGYTLETQPGIIAGYYVLSDGWRFGAVLARERFVETELNILQPLPGASFLIGEAIPLQVSVYGDGLEITDTAEINWTLDAPLSVGGTLVAAGVNTFTSFEFPGDYTLFANYTGTPQSTASVTISVRAGSAPNVEITSPANGTLLADVGGGDPYPFYRASFSATATDGEDGVLSGASLRWSYRRLGATTWIDTGLTGTEVVIPLEDVDVSCITGTTYEVRVQATDSDMSVASDINQVRIAVIFCK